MWTVTGSPCASGTRPGRIAGIVGAAAEQVAPYRDRSELWRAEGGRVESFVGRFIEAGNSGDELEPELLTELGIRLSPGIRFVDRG